MLGAWAHTHKSSDRHAPLPCMTRNSVGNFNCAETGDRTGNSRDSSCEKITCDRRENGHGPIQSARTMPKGLETVAVSSLVFPDLYPFLHPCQS